MSSDGTGPRAPDLSGRVALVTGARRGLGRAHAEQLAALGATVVVNGRPGSPGLDAVVETIAAAGGTAHASYRDVATAEGGAAAVADAVERFGRLDVLVNNAGILRPDWFEDETAERYEATRAVQFDSLFHVTRPALRAMRAAGYGRIVNTSSGTAFGMAALASYAAAKAGVVGFTRSLGLEYADTGLRINAVMPNAETPAMANDPIPGFDRDEPFLRAYGEIADRNGTDLVAALVGALADEGCPVTGETFTALGGRYSRVVFGVTEGWMSDPEAPVTPADVAASFARIVDLDAPMLFPRSLRDEYESVAERLRVVRGTAART
jgi:NAD(P)-dependent dehydrogenase (short-subunit alcohol dehydrogenase family)